MSDTAPAPANDATPAIPTDPAALAARDAELNALAESDEPKYRYSDNGALANEHVAIRQALQPKSGEQDDVQQTDDDGLTDDDESATDLDAADGDDAEAAQGDEPAETGIKPLGPGEDATDEELADWRAEHGVPDDPTYYEAPDVDGIEWDPEALSPILEAVHAHDIPQQAVAEALTKYAERIKAQQAEIKERDRENAKAVRSELGEAGIAAVKTAAKVMPAELRQMLNAARLPDGTRLVNQPELLRMIASAYGTGNARQVAPQQQDHRTTMQQELAEIDAAMHQDVASLYKPWKTTGKLATDYKLEILRQLGNEGPAKPNSADLRAEARELEQLRTRDPEMFMYGSWRGGRSGADRLAELRAGRG